MQLTEDQLGVVCEIFNIGVGRAAGSLSDLIGGIEVQLSVPTARLVSIRDLAAEVSEGQSAKVCAVSQKYAGPFAGTAQLIYSEQQSLELVQAMLGTNTPIERFDEAEAEALLEIGNIVLNCCVGSFGDAFGVEFATAPPAIATDTVLNVLSDFGARDPEECVLHLRMDFILAVRDLAGHLALNMDIGAVEVLRGLTDDVLAGVDD